MDHTWFRKNENQAGRWTSPDPYLGSMEIGNPQSFNRYSYVSGDPINFVDPSGLHWAINYASCVTIGYITTGLDTPNQQTYEIQICNLVWAGPNMVAEPEFSGGGINGDNPDIENDVTFANARTSGRESFSECVNRKMKPMFAKLRRMMWQNARNWGIGTGVAGAGGGITGLAASLGLIFNWVDNYNNFVQDEFNPAMRKARQECDRERNPRRTYFV